MSTYLGDSWHGVGLSRGSRFGVNLDKYDKCHNSNVYSLLAAISDYQCTVQRSPYGRWRLSLSLSRSLSLSERVLFVSFFLGVVVRFTNSVWTF